MKLRGFAAWTLVALGFSTSGCAGVVGAGAAVVVLGAGVVSMTCYDRFAITVVDQATGSHLCDAKVTFTKGSSVTEATNCYAASLAEGKYTMRVSRPGLAPYEQPVEVTTGKSCEHAVQTIYVAMDRPEWKQEPQRIAPAPTIAATPSPAPPPPAPAGVLPISPAAPPVSSSVPPEVSGPSEVPVQPEAPAP